MKTGREFRDEVIRQRLQGSVQRSLHDMVEGVLQGLAVRAPAHQVAQPLIPFFQHIHQHVPRSRQIVVQVRQQNFNGSSTAVPSAFPGIVLVHLFQGVVCRFPVQLFGILDDLRLSCQL